MGGLQGKKWRDGLFAAALLCLLLVQASCRRETIAVKDNPRLADGVVLQDVTYQSAALQRTVTYRVYLPKNLKSGVKLPVVYLLHGAGDDFRAWSNKADVAKYAAAGMILVMPDGDNAYYINSAGDARERYEDFVVEELRRDVEGRFPAMQVREARAIAGISRGGYGAITLALKHPELYAFAAGISAALDIPERRFSYRRPLQSLTERKNFGPVGSATRKENDPFVLVRSANPASAAYMMLTCGEQDSLIGVNRLFAERLKQKHYQYAVHMTPGGHDWSQWDEQIPIVFAQLNEQMKVKTK